MVDEMGIYRCNICGNVVQMMIYGGGELVCCGEEMELLKPQHDEMNELSEKHVPEIDEVDGKKYVVLRKHPMIAEHYIQFIQVCSKDKTEIRTKFFNPNQAAEFDISGFDGVHAIELCNIHGLWSNRQE